MPDLIYTDPRLAAIYEVLNPPGEDTLFFLNLAGSLPLRILEVGCGTGQLACELARRGHRVTGADPATAMLNIARHRPGGNNVKWIETDAAGLDLTERFDLIIMTGHVFQVFITDDDVSEAIMSIKRHLVPNGRLAFETRNPAVREWEEWTPGKTSQTENVPGIGLVTVQYDTQAVNDNLVTFVTHFQFPDDEVMAVPSTLRFMNQEELRRHLRQAGFAEFEWFGNWDRIALDPTSPEIIVIAS